MFAEINKNLKMYYELSGKGESVVLISGYRGDHTLWNLVKKTLEPHFQILVFDNCGVGQTENSEEPLTIEKMADAAMKLIDHLQLKNPHIVGQSMGSAIAQVIAKKYGEKINKLILLNSVMKFNIATLTAMTGAFKLRQENASFESLFTIGLPWSFSSQFLESDENILMHKNRLLGNKHPQSIENQARQLAALENFNSTEWIYEIKNATLVIASKNDIATLPNEGHQLANNIGGAIFKQISGGHASIFEYPNEVGDLIRIFFTGDSLYI